MPRTPFRAALAAVVLLALAVTTSGCTAAVPVVTPSPTPTPVATPGPPAPLGDGTLRVGTLFPRSGPLAFLGPAQRAGVDAAVRTINAAGGVNGARVAVTHADAGEPGRSTARTAFASLVKKKVDVVIGPSSSVVATELLPRAVAAGVPLISPAATLPQLTTLDSAGYLFRTIPSDELEGVALATALRLATQERVAIIRGPTVADDLLSARLAEAVVAGGGQVVASVTVPAGTRSPGRLLGPAVAARPDAVVLVTQGGGAQDDRALITALVKAKVGGSRLWLTSQNLADYSRSLPAGRLAGVRGILEGALPDRAARRTFDREKKGLANYRYAAEAYDATILAALAATQGADDAGAVIASQVGFVASGGVACESYAACIAALSAGQDIDYRGLSGPVDLDAAGDVTAATFGLYRYSRTNRYAAFDSVYAELPGSR